MLPACFRSLLPIGELGTDATHLRLPVFLDTVLRCYAGPLPSRTEVSQIISSESVAQENSEGTAATRYLKPADIADF